MDKIKITVNGKTYDCINCLTDEEKEKGLQGVEELKEDEGAWFPYDEPQELAFWMKDTSIPLDIIFIDEDLKVMSVMPGVPNNEEDVIVENGAQYVLELNRDSGVRPGDEVEVEDAYPELTPNKIYIMGSDGHPQGEILGGERIFSRISTRKLIALAKKAFMSKDDKDYKKLGKYAFKELDAQDNREPEYVTNENAKA